MIRNRRPARRGAITIEAAIVYPLMFMMLLGIIVLGMGVFRYQMVACMAREAARFASVRGSDWRKEAKQPSPTQAEIVADVVTPMTVAMEPAKVTVRVQWVNGVTGQAVDWDASGKRPTTLTNPGKNPVANRVRVTVTYRWTPELFLVGPIDLQSVCETPIAS